MGDRRTVPMLRGTRAIELSIPVRDEVRFHDVVDGELVGSAVTSDLHAAVLGPADSPGKIAPPLDTHLEPNTRALPNKPGKIPLSPQGPIKPGRARFQLIRVRNPVGHLRRRRYVAADPLAIVDADELRSCAGRATLSAVSRRPVDEKPQHRTVWLATKLDFDQIEAGGPE